jgi:hypothetical protein
MGGDIRFRRLGPIGTQLEHRILAQSGQALSLFGAHPEQDRSTRHQDPGGRCRSGETCRREDG